MNLLVATRLSHDTDESTSIERQTEQGQQYAKLHGHTVVATTEDVDVSGAISPFDRDDLGPWLTDPEKLAKWDAIAVAKIDRLSRSLLDFVTFMQWADAHGKKIISIGEGIDFSTHTGRLMGQMLAMFAEFERARMSERRADAARKLREMGAHGGGMAPYGYKAEKQGSQFYLVVDQAEKAVLIRMAELIIAGNSARQTARILQDDNVPTRKGGRWDANSVITFLRNDVIRGVIMHDGKPVRDEDGMPLRLPEACIDDEMFSRVQGKLDSNAAVKGTSANRKGAAMLLNVVTCECGSKLYMNRRAAGNRYRHIDGTECKKSYKASDLEGMVESELLANIGWLPMTETVVIKGENHDDEIAAVEKSISDLDEIFDEMPAKTYARMQSRLEEKLAALLKLPRTDDEVKEVPIPGVTYANHWKTLDEAGKGKLLRDAQVSAVVSRGPVAPLPGNRANTAQDGTMERVGRFSMLVAGRVSMSIWFGSLGSLRDAVKGQ